MWRTWPSVLTFVINYCVFLVLCFLLLLQCWCLAPFDQPIKRWRFSLNIAFFSFLSISFILHLLSLQLANRPPPLSLPPHVLCWTVPLSMCSSSSSKACRRSSPEWMCVTGWLTAIRTHTCIHRAAALRTHVCRASCSRLWPLWEESRVCVFLYFYSYEDPEPSELERNTYTSFLNSFQLTWFNQGRRDRGIPSCNLYISSCFKSVYYLCQGGTVVGLLDDFTVFTW